MTSLISLVAIVSGCAVIRVARPAVVILVALGMTVPGRCETPFTQDVQPFLKKYCFHCHGAEKQKGERRFDRLTGQIRNDNALVDKQDILDQLNLSEMPPKDSLQPTTDERRAVIRWLTRRIRQYHDSRRDARGKNSVLRRLNSREYRNTVRDLLRLNMTMFNPTSTFPKDQTVEHLDNVGSSLVTSGYLMARYLDAAEQCVEKAILSTSKPSVEKWVFRDGFRQQPEIDQVHRKTNRFKHMTLYDVKGADKHEGAYGPILAFKEGVPHDGYYKIRLRAEAVNRKHPYDPKFLGTDPKEPLRLGIVAGNYRVGQLHKPQPIEPLLAEIDLADKSQWYSVRVWLDAGYTPRFTFQNGLMDARSLWARLIRKYPEQFPQKKKGGIVENRFNAIAYGKLPQIHIHEIEIEGPYYDEWPAASQRALLGENARTILESGSVSDEQLRPLIEAFATKAYRRKATADDVERLMRVVAKRIKDGRTSLEAFADGAKAALCSPNFLFIEPSSKQQFLSQSSLASRLSYFLWSSMPDQRLLDLAADGKLKKPHVLRAQVDRMLEDKRSEAFVSGFLESWLNMRELGATPPDRGKFRAFYHYDLDFAMKRETHLFTRHLIDDNLSIVNFLDSNFTFANKELARFYGLSPVRSHQFEKVAINDKRRGGLLGQASVLTLTANGIDTSPVVRGVWLLENILGTPPSPPPPDVEPLDPDIRGAKTIRDQLEKHRSVASCNDCHRKIDPLGFALENFDPVGRWRTSYGRDAPVDASGKLPSGEQFKDVRGLKRILVQQKARFARALAEKLLMYGIGRQLVPSDRPHIDRIISECEQKKFGFRDLILLVVQSEPFSTLP